MKEKKIQGMIPMPKLTVDTDEKMKTFTSGAVRSKKVPAYWQIPFVALREIAKRFDIGEGKYGTHNWRKALHKGDREFVRQFYNHTQEHMLRCKDLCAPTISEVGFSKDSENEGVLEHLGAAAWGLCCLMEYAEQDTEGFCRALSMEIVEDGEKEEG